MSLVRGALHVSVRPSAALLVVTVGPGWALMVDAVTWFAAAADAARRSHPRRGNRGAADAPERSPTCARGGRSSGRTTWLWVVVLAFGFLNAIHIGALFTLGPAVAKDTIGEQGWGLVLSAEALGLLADDGGAAAGAARAAAALRHAGHLAARACR